MSAKSKRVPDVMSLARRLAPAVLVLSLGACDWFTDFKDQPRIEPWEAYAAPGLDTAALQRIPFRGQPQYSVPVSGTEAPAFWVSHVAGIPQLDSLSVLPNPVPADERSLANGRKYYQINCAVCHGEAGMGNGPATLYGMTGFNIAQGPRAGVHRRLHLRDHPQRTRPDADVRPHRGAGPLGRRELHPRPAGSLRGGDRSARRAR